MAADPALIPNRPSAVRVALVFPDLLGTYGDSGNAVILAQRLRWRGLGAEIVEINAGGTVPDSCDLYVIGGGEDQPQSLAARELNRQRSVHRAVDRGAVVLAICAGLQIMGRTFVGPDGVEQPGLGLLDCVTVRGVGRRAVGELVVEPAGATGLPVMTGYENHGGVTILSPGAEPLGRVRSGVGNGRPEAPGHEGIPSADRTPNAGRRPDADRTHNAGRRPDADRTPNAGRRPSADRTPNAGRRPDAGPTPDADRTPKADPTPAADRTPNAGLTDGAVNGRVWATYMHGPVLARNPAFADRLLSLVTGTLEPLDDRESEALRAERLRAAPAEASGGTGHGSRIHGLARWARHLTARS